MYRRSGIVIPVNDGQGVLALRTWEIDVIRLRVDVQRLDIGTYAHLRCAVALPIDYRQCTLRIISRDINLVRCRVHHHRPGKLRYCNCRAYEWRSLCLSDRQTCGGLQLSL